MKQNVSYKYRIYPNVKQKEMFAKTFGCVRYYWNAQVAVFNSYNKETNPKPKFLTTKEMRDAIPWMKEVSHAAVQHKERDFYEYKKQFFNKTRKKQIGRPSFKKKGNKASFRLSNKAYRLKGDNIYLARIGNVRMVVDRSIPESAKLLSVTISKNPSNQYFASVCTEHEVKPLPKTGHTVGIDVGIKSFLVQSDGVVIANPSYFRKSQAKLKRMQQHLSKKRKGSRRYEKCRIKVAKIHQKVYNQREWFLHNESTRIVKEYDVIAIEDLNIIGMIKERKMSALILDASWAKFFRMLEYKAEWYSKELIKIDRFAASSKTCNNCGWRNTELTLKDREFKCPICGLIIDRDLGAARNIKALAINSAQRTQSECKPSSDAIHNEAFSVTNLLIV